MPRLGKLHCLGTSIVVAVLGCSDRPKIVPVSGVLTYQGTPVANAFLDFVPEVGRPSWAETDEEGRFKLIYDRRHDGASIGKYKVCVRMRPATQAERDAAMRGERFLVSKERAAFFEKYSAENSKQQVVIDKETKELKLDWN